MATPIAAASISPLLVSLAADLPKPHPPRPGLLLPWAGGRRVIPRRAVLLACSPSTPPDISARVAESIRNAEETCAEDATSGECAAAWDEVEELSAAASHARERLKNSQPLESYCKDNPESDECRIYG